LASAAFGLAGRPDQRGLGLVKRQPLHHDGIIAPLDSSRCFTAAAAT
jgi:hypothetical protein